MYGRESTRGVDNLYANRDEEWQHERRHRRRSSRLGLRDLLLDRLRVKGVVLGFWFLILVVSSVSKPNSACHAE
jgi:hypothetical protein